MLSDKTRIIANNRNRLTDSVPPEHVAKGIQKTSRRYHDASFERSSSSKREITVVGPGLSTHGPVQRGSNQEDWCEGVPCSRWYPISL